jgi:adenine-specific DNA-methyltransferase
MKAWRALTPESRRSMGQFFTPGALAQMIAERPSLRGLPVDGGRLRILDPGAGVGALGAALVQRVAREAPELPVHLTMVESDPKVLEGLEGTAEAASRWAFESGVDLTVETVHADFVEWATERFLGVFRDDGLFDIAILNPPYLKIATRSRHRALTAQVACEVTNLYAAFVALSIEALKDGGRMVAITPRSFTNGPYFRPFRRFLNERTVFESVDVFESRASLFSDTDVLQENVIYCVRRARAKPDAVRLLFHGGDGDVVEHEADYESVMPADDPECFIFLRNGEDDHRTAERVNRLPSRLNDLAADVSTGRVVTFRSREDLRARPDPDTAPLLYPHHLRGGYVTWPVESEKPNALAVNEHTRPMLFPRGHYVAVKRFTSKEERRRVTPTHVPAEVFEGESIAFENHVNVFHSCGAGLDHDLAVGLTLYLGSSIVDQYFRQFSGHTQVNATDLRSLPYPDRDTLSAMGRTVEDAGALTQDEVDRIVDMTVWGARE